MKKVNKKVLATFFENLSFLLSSGIDTLTAVTLLNNSKDKKMLAITQRVMPKISAGQELSNIFYEHSNFFGTRYSAPIQAGIESGNLAQVMSNLSVQLNNENKIRKQVKNAMIYPVILLVLVVIVGLYIFLNIAPQMAKNISELSDGELPAISKAAIAISTYISNKRYTVIFVIAVFFIAIKLIFTMFKEKISKMVINLPVVGRLLLMMEFSEFYSQMAYLLDAGVTMEKALEISISTIENIYVRKRLHSEATRLLQQGYSFGFVLTQSVFVSNIEAQCVIIAEQSGRLTEMLYNLSKRKEFEAEQETKTLLALIQPIMLIIMGAVIGVVALAVYMPMMSI